MREAWTDERLDDLKEGMHHEFGLVRREMDTRFDGVDTRFDGVDTRFDGVDTRFDRVDTRFEEVRTEIRELRSEMNARFEGVNARFDSLQRTMIFGHVSIVVALVGAVFAKGLL